MTRGDAPETLRLDPTTPLVWRSPREIQLGTGPRALIVGDVTPELEVALGRLRTSGVSRNALRRAVHNGSDRADAATVEALVDRIASLAMRTPEPNRRSIAVRGPRAAELVARFEDLGLPAAEWRTDLREARITGFRIALACEIGGAEVRPDRGVAAMSRDLPHLVSVRVDGETTVGPLVLPGTSPCLMCLELHRRDEDTAWPDVAAQLAAIPGHSPLDSPAGIGVLLEAARGFILAGDTALAGRRVRITRGGYPEVEPVRWHDGCACRALPESGSANAQSSGARRDSPRTGAGSTWPG